MVGDLIQQVVRSEKQERVASGDVDGFDIELQKKRYGPSHQRNNWKVRVINKSVGVDSENIGLTHKQAKEEFEYLLDKYDLEEDEDFE